jgi:hypothetical protein
MRSVTYRFSPDGGLVDAGEWGLADCAGRLEEIQHVRLLADGSALARITLGDVAPGQGPRLAELEGIRDVQTADGPDGTLVQVHVWPGEAFAALLDAYRAHPVEFDFPIEVIDPAVPTLRLVATGHIDELKGLIDESRLAGSVTIEEVGSYEPPSQRLFAGLTERQQQVLRTALDRGYYDVPRDVTYEDIARDLDCSASTVGQHLRRIEARVLSAIVPCGQADEQLEEPPVH